MRINYLRWAVLLRTSHFAPRTSLKPFFATKPTGQGTGLGLSLSYDLEKAHGGKEGEGSEFIVQLPIV